MGLKTIINNFIDAVKRDTSDEKLDIELQDNLTNFLENKRDDMDLNHLHELTESVTRDAAKLRGIHEEFQTRIFEQMLDEIKNGTANKAGISTAPKADALKF